MRHRLRLAYDPRDLGSSISQVRKQAGLTQAELADRLRVTRATIVRLEHGEAVSVETVMGALSECGYALAVVPKFTRLTVVDDG